MTKTMIEFAFISNVLDQNERKIKEKRNLSTLFKYKLKIKCQNISF